MRDILQVHWYLVTIIGLMVVTALIAWQLFYPQLWVFVCLLAVMGLAPSMMLGIRFRGISRDCGLTIDRQVQKPDGLVRHKTCFPHVGLKHCTPYGYRFRFHGLPKVATVDRLMEQRENLILELNAYEIVIDKQGVLVGTVNVYLRDPLENPPSEDSLELRPYGIASGEVYLGWDIKGLNVYLNVLGYSGALISGAPNAGKTVLVKRVAAEMALSDVTVSIANGKNDSKLDVFMSAGIPVIGDNKAVFLEQLRGRERLRQERMCSLPGDYQDQPVNSRPPLDVQIVDEFQEYLSAITRDERPIVEEINALLTRLIKLQRSAGMLTILATQKLDSQAIPTALRDVIPSKISGYTTTPEMTRMALGNLRDDEPRPDDKHVIPPGKPGRMIIAGQTDTARLFQVANITDDQITEAFQGGASVSDSRQ